MTTAEVAEHLRLKQRKIYQLVRDEEIPYTRVTGKLLFPRQVIDQWVMGQLQDKQGTTLPRPPVYAGSQDPLLEWALRESQAGLGALCNGSGDGVQKLLAMEAQLVGLHVLDPDTGHYNDPTRLGLAGIPDLVMIEWSRRTQGLVVAPDNRLSITSVDDLRRPGIRIAHRQHGAGAATLFGYLLQQADIDIETLDLAQRPSLSEDDLALEVRDGRADCGLAVEAAARRHGLHFIALAEERFDLAMRRRDYFEEPVQRLLAFARSSTFAERVVDFGGYDAGQCGSVRYNA